jgi:hypothetical protein
MTVTVIGYSQLQARFAAISGPVATVGLMKALGVAAVREQKLLEAKHRKTGITGASIRLGTVTASSVVTEVGGAGAFLEFGTRPHEITPKAAKALAWASGPAGGPFRRLSGAPRKGTSSSNMTFAKRVHHPGTSPSPFMVPGAEAAISKSGASIGTAIVQRWDAAG